MSSDKKDTRQLYAILWAGVKVYSLLMSDDEAFRKELKFNILVIRHRVGGNSMLKVKYHLWSYLILILIGCLGCAGGHKIKYHDIIVNLHNEGSRTLAVAVLDQRNYVVNGEKDPSFIGVFRAANGNPWDVFTESNQPLAEDMAMVLCSSLNDYGYKTIPVLQLNNATMDQVLDKLRETKAEGFILLKISQWVSDTSINTIIWYYVELLAMDKDGNVIGKSAVKGEDDLGGSFMDPSAYAKKEVPKLYENTLEILFNNSSIVSALSSKQTLVPQKNIERPGYSFQPPNGQEWVYYSRKERNGIFSRSYGNKPSPTHSFSVFIGDFDNNYECSDPDEFRNQVQQEKGYDSSRFKVIQNEIKLDPIFGTCSVRYYQILEDHGAANKGDNAYLIFKYYGYHFIHPYSNNQRIDISYSERGGVEEMDPDFENQARMFIDGLKLKENE